MSEPFLAEIRIVGFNFAPVGFALCDGQILPIDQNQSLYSLLGTSYGGDGRTTFALPDLRGRSPMHVSADYPRGQARGEESHALTVAQIPAHTHIASATDAGEAGVTSDDPAGRLLAQSSQTTYGSLTTAVEMESGTVADAGGGQAHDNMQPYIALNFCIALRGLFPSRN